jgi:KaiC/GvpD/RAD55 family RecA-like ATPase
MNNNVVIHRLATGVPGLDVILGGGLMARGPRPS